MKREIWLLMLKKDNRYRLHHLSNPNVPAIKHDGYRWAVMPERMWLLKGWRPNRREHFFSDLTAHDGIQRRIAIYNEADAVDGNVEPLDRLRMRNIVPERLTTLAYKAWVYSPLYRLRIRRLRSVVSQWHVVVFLLAAFFIILFVIWYSGR